MSKIAIKAARAAYFAKIKEPISVQFVMGRCIPSAKQNAAKIEVTKLQMDPRLKIVRYNIIHNALLFLVLRIDLRVDLKIFPMFFFSQQNMTSFSKSRQLYTLLIRRRR